MKRIFPALWMLALVTVFGFAWAKDYQVIRFGVDPTYPPFASKTVEGTLTGFEIDLGNALCARLKVKCRWVESDFDGMIPSLNAGKIDAILASMAVTEKRKQVIDFSAEVFSSPTALVFKKGRGLGDGLQALQGKTVGYLQGSIQEVYAQKTLAEAGVKVVAYPNQDQVYDDLLAGRLDASIQDWLQAQQGFLKSSQGSAYEAGPPIESDLLPSSSAIGLAKGNQALKTLLDQGLATLHADGTYARLYQQYLGIPAPAKAGE